MNFPPIKAVWVDDLRNPTDFLTDQNDFVGLHWLKTYESGFKFVVRNAKTLERIHLDNDLSDEKDRQGYHIFNAIERLVYQGKMPNLKEIIIHSDNAGAVQRMMTAKQNFKDRFGIVVRQVVYRK